MLYHPEHAERLGYLVAHECGHILRLHEAPPEYRKLPATRTEHRWRVAYELAQDLYRLESLGLNASRLAVLLRMWHDGVIRQLGNLPVDMRIERWLFEKYPGLHTLQRRALLGQLTENAKVLSRQVRGFTPPKIYRASNLMNAAYARYVGQLLGRPESTPGRSSIALERSGAMSSGRRLTAVTKAMWKPSRSGVELSVWMAGGSGGRCRRAARCMSGKFG